MQNTAPTSRYSFHEEVANSITHALGIVFGIVALGLLTAFATSHGDVWHMVSGCIYAATIILLYTASTLYHSIPLQKAKQILRQFDHASIFLLIAGSYTPFTLVTLRGPWGWSLFCIIWACALFGMVAEFTPLKRFRAMAVSLYLVMGWSVVVAIKPLWAALPENGLWLLVGGGLSYTLGVVFYLWRSLPFSHAIWHLFVLLGTVLHFFSVLLYVIPVFD